MMTDRTETTLTILWILIPILYIVGFAICKSIRTKYPESHR